MAKEGAEGAAAADWSAPAQEPVSPPPPARDTCGEPLSGMGRNDPSAPPPDGRTHEACRAIRAAGQPTGLFEALFGLPDKWPRSDKAW
ncbi:hypothetical protein [Streptomyces sp. NPDC056785]|uniref:hypothetical protein n=1 Tax=Streptomyces sp. NPDC056785 TaxID=3345944 RepID=UPI0036BC6767